MPGPVSSTSTSAHSSPLRTRTMRCAPSCPPHRVERMIRRLTALARQGGLAGTIGTSRRTRADFTPDAAHALRHQRRARSIHARRHHLAHFARRRSALLRMRSHPSTRWGDRGRASHRAGPQRGRVRAGRGRRHRPGHPGTAQEPHLRAFLHTKGESGNGLACGSRPRSPVSTGATWLRWPAHEERCSGSHCHRLLGIFRPGPRG